MLAFLTVLTAKGWTEDFKILRQRAEEGDAEAQYMLGDRYLNGEGVTQDASEAVKWLRKAAEQGNDEAQFALGLTYFKGMGVSQDYAEAAKWLRKAAE